MDRGHSYCFGMVRNISSHFELALTDLDLALLLTAASANVAQAKTHLSCSSILI